MKKNQKGFGVVELAIVFVVVGLLGAGGWYIWSSNKSGATKKSAATQTQSSSDTQASEQKYLEVSELGVKFALKDPLLDAYYSKNAGKSSVSLKVHSLDDEDDCTNTELAVAGLFKVNKDATDIDGVKLTTVYKGYLDGDDFYYIATSQHDCTGKATGESDLITKVRAAFVKASETITRL